MKFWLRIVIWMWFPESCDNSPKYGESRYGVSNISFVEKTFVPIFSNLQLISGSSSPLNKLGSPLCPNYSSLMWGLGSPLVPHLGRDLPHLPSSPPSLPPHLLPSWCLHSLLLHSQANLLAHHLSLQSPPIQGMGKHTSSSVDKSDRRQNANV